MTRWLNRVVLPLGIVLGLMLGMACGGDATPAPTAAPGGPTSAPSIREIAERGASRTPIAEVSETTTPTGPAATTTPRAVAKASFSPLRAVRSFNYAMSMEFTVEGAPEGDGSGSLDLEGAYVAPDRFSMSLALDIPDNGDFSLPGEIKMVGIGQDVYANFAGEWQKSSLADLGLNSLMPTQDEFYENFAVEGLDGEDFDEEERNGVDTKHYVLDASDIGRLIAAEASAAEASQLLQAVQDVAMELWVANDGGYLVAMTFDGTINPSTFAGMFGAGDAGAAGGMTIDFGLDFDLSEINSDEIQIEPPI